MRSLKDYEPILSRLMHVIAPTTEFVCRPGLAQIFAAYPQLIIAMNHSTPLSWLPSMALLALKACENGGGDRRPMGVMDDFFFRLPLIKVVARLLTQAERRLSYRELSSRFREQGDIDLVVYPEGSNCFFGHSDQIQDFRSPKFVDLSIRTGAPILLAVHDGSEGWAKTVRIPREWTDFLPLLPRFAYDFLERRLKKTGLLVLPLFPRPLENFVMLCELYRPTLTVEDLAKDPQALSEQLLKETAKIRFRMSEMLSELRGRKNALSLPSSRIMKSPPSVETTGSSFLEI